MNREYIKLFIESIDKNRLTSLQVDLFSNVPNWIVKNKLLSRDCDGCSLLQADCKRRFARAGVGEKVYCPNGDAHLIDTEEARN